MKVIILQVLMHASVVSMYFLDLFRTQENELMKPIGGFNALFHQQFFGIGNLFIWLMLVGSLYQFVYRLLLIIFRSHFEKKKASLVSVTNIQLFSGLVIATLLGTYLTMLGVLMIAIVVASAFIHYKYEK